MYGRERRVLHFNPVVRRVRLHPADKIWDWMSKDVDVTQ